MNTKQGYYSLIQYCPDPSRVEAANVGVLLFCPELQFIEARMARGNDRIRRFFRGNVDLRQINAAKDALQSRLEVPGNEFTALSDLEEFASTRANELRITTPRSMKVCDPKEELDALFKELVGGRIRRKKESRPELRQLDEYFHRPSLENRIRFNQKIELPVSKRRIVIPYAYRNAKLNLVQPQTFAAGSQGMDRAMCLACEGDIIQRHSWEDGMERRFVVVPVIEPADEATEIEKRVREILVYYKIRCVGTNEIEPFVEEVAKEAH